MSGRLSAYKYDYRFKVEDDIIAVYKCKGLQPYAYEMRTNFKVKRLMNGETTTIGSERFGESFSEDDGELWLRYSTRFRLKDYWMSDDEINSLFLETLDFAKGERSRSGRAVIGVVVELDVTTVEQEGEPIDVIGPESLIPIEVWPFSHFPWPFSVPYVARKFFLKNLVRVRVEDKSGLDVMEVCGVCGCKSILGAQLSPLACDHVFHSACIFHWLNNHNDSCPTCASSIPVDIYEGEIMIKRVNQAVEDEKKFKRRLSGGLTIQSDMAN